jgi:pyridoxal phosphate enzyme (YggS family)
VFICVHLWLNPSVSIADNVASIRERIAAAAARSGRRADEITLVAVSKTFPAECIREAYAAGVRHFGENRVQEWESKAAQLADLRDATWHLVGHLQSNKARRAVELFSTIDSVDSIALAQRLDRIVAESLVETAEALGSAGAGHPIGPAKRPILIEVRLAPEETKHGVETADLPAMVEAVRALPHLDLRGLMCIPPWCANPEDARPFFRRLRELRDSVRQQLFACHSEGASAMRREAAHRATEEPQGLGLGSDAAAAARILPILPELSMGMSHDFEAAIEEGATQIRIGTAIFGVRE